MKQIHVLKIVCVFLLISALLIFTLSRSTNDGYANTPPKLSGIVYFDIDDTLTNMPAEDKERIMEHCVEKGYKVGIITASMRSPSNICSDTGGSGVHWAADSMCTELKKDNFELFNSLLYTGGKTDFKFPSYPYDSLFYGRQKGWQMLESSKKLGVEPANTYLFDDNQNVLVGAKEINPYGNFIYVNNDVPNGEYKLDYDRISKIIV